MEKSKKTAVITFRTEEWIKNEIGVFSSANKWSSAQTVEEIIKIFIANPHPGEIVIKAKDFIELAKELEKEGCEGVQVRINLRVNEEETDIYKTLTIDGLESGGRGMIANFDEIKELTEEEILELK